jgi:hypothetical protein
MKLGSASTPPERCDATCRSQYARCSQSREIFDRADSAGRDPTPTERGEVEAILDAAQAQKRIEDQYKFLDGDATWDHGGADHPWVQGGEGPGDVFVRSKGFRSISDSQTRPQQRTSGAVEVPLATKGTLTTTPGTALNPAYYAPVFGSRGARSRSAHARPFEPSQLPPSEDQDQ